VYAPRVLRVLLGKFVVSLAKKLIENSNFESKWDFTMNIAKTKYMSVRADTNLLEMNNGDIITGCTGCRCLETTFTKDGRDTKNIGHSVTQARKILGALNGVWWSKNITRNRKKMIYNVMVKSVLIYGAETCSLYEDDRRRNNATEMDGLRRSSRISKLDRKTKEYIRGKMDAQDMILDDITQKQLIWYGNVERMDPTRLPKIMIHWKPGRRKNEAVPKEPGKMEYIQP
jgi:hypothetical protein